MLSAVTGGKGRAVVAHVHERVAVVSATEELGHHHPSTAAALLELAETAQRDGDHDEAEIAFRRALSILQTQPVPDRAALAGVLDRLRSLFVSQGRDEDAAAMRARADALLADHP